MGEKLARWTQRKLEKDSLVSHASSISEANIRPINLADQFCFFGL